MIPDNRSTDLIAIFFNELQLGPGLRLRWPPQVLDGRFSADRSKWTQHGVLE